MNCFSSIIVTLLMQGPLTYFFENHHSTVIPRHSWTNQLCSRRELHGDIKRLLERS